MNNSFDGRGASGRNRYWRQKCPILAFMVGARRPSGRLHGEGAWRSVPRV